MPRLLSRRDDAPRRQLRVAIVADGPLEAPTTNSGVALGLVTALRSHPQVSDVLEVNSLLGPIGKAVARAASFHPRRGEWNRRYLQGLVRQRLRSLKRDWIIFASRRRPHVIIHVRNVYTPTSRPYFAFVDTTYEIRQREWPHGGFGVDHLQRRLKFEARYLRSAAGVLTAGEYVAAQLNRSAVTPNATAVGAGLNLRVRQHAKPDSSRRIVFVGREFDRKGGSVLLNAFRQVRRVVDDAELHIVGSSETIESDGVTSHGIVNDREILSEIYASAGVFCLPANFEPFGLVVVEAMAHGLPCVVTQVGVLPDLVGDGDAGIVVPRGDETRLAVALVRLLQDADLRRRMGSAARVRSQSFTWDAVADNVVRVVEASMPASGITLTSRSRQSRELQPQPGGHID